MQISKGRISNVREDTGFIRGNLIHSNMLFCLQEQRKEDTVTVSKSVCFSIVEISSNMVIYCIK